MITFGVRACTVDCDLDAPVRKKASDPNAQLFRKPIRRKLRKKRFVPNPIEGLRDIQTDRQCFPLGLDRLCPTMDQEQSYFNRRDLLLENIMYSPREHVAAERVERPPPPPRPAGTAPRCARCNKAVEGGSEAWAGHWARHWERDARPYRCALCEKAFRDAHQILKHGEYNNKNKESN
ncbi:hypothetical protein evm_014907 [Chilo suppressalis]|nr:hypothetical protein evm_014907 [Chilo suppressalis]